MARQIGSAVLTGTFDGITFYHNCLHGNLVRRTGGVTSKKYHSDQRYAAARDNSKEFCAVSATGKLIRNALGAFVHQVKDGTMVNRMNQELVRLKQRDRMHLRGERRPDVMMTDGNANVFFRIFQFNDDAKLYDLTESYPVVERKRNRLIAKDVKLKASAFPEGATHAGLTLVRTVIDFDASRYETVSSNMAVVSRETHECVSLSTDPAPTSFAGTEIVCLQVIFYREYNGDLVQLKERVHAMGILQLSAAEQSPVIDEEPVLCSRCMEAIAAPPRERYYVLPSGSLMVVEETG
jgi:hypothetical protein